MPHKLISDISQIKNLPLQVKINRIQISPALEVIKWPGNGSLTIELDQDYPGENIEIDFGKPEIATWGSLEISANGKDWSKVNYTRKEPTDCQFTTETNKGSTFYQHAASGTRNLPQTIYYNNRQIKQL